MLEHLKLSETNMAHTKGHKLTLEDIDELTSALRNSLLDSKEWQEKLEKVREEARKWRVRALDAEAKLARLKELL